MSSTIVPLAPMTSLTLAQGFAAGWRGEEGDSPEAVEVALAELYASGQRAFPDVGLAALDLAVHAGARARVDRGALEAIRGLRAADLFLACGCVHGLPAAHRAFDRAFLGKLPLYLRGLRLSHDVVEEARRALLERLFLPAAGRPPRIAQYSGRGALEGWVRVAAVRTALNLIEARKGADPGGGEAALARAVDRGDDPELRFLKERYRAPFAAAFREALEAAPRRARALLHFTFVEGLTPERVARIYKVHRTTAMRWIDAARADVLADTRARLGAQYHLTPAECDGVFQMVESRLDLTLGSLLESAARSAAGTLAGE
jgi:RNA polymerase sigma-70 factor, ECF subfamily